MNTFKCLRVRETGEITIQQLDMNELNLGELLIEVHYSSVNYKDALSAHQNRGVTRNYPHTPGIDAAGIVIESRVPEFKEGDRVVVTGYDLGMNTHGGFSEYITVPASWAVLLPDTLTVKQSMLWGTAGLTAALSVEKLLNHGIDPENGPVFVSGATGGVGILAISILLKLGYEVHAMSGKESLYEDLKTLGVREVMGHDALASEKALARPRYQAAIDTVGGSVLANVLKYIADDGALTACGNVAGDTFTSSVYPFILRGITLYGIDSVNISQEQRIRLWNNLSDIWYNPDVEPFVNDIPLSEIKETLINIYQGNHQGRTRVQIK